MTHLYRTRVYWQDTDAGGIVYHANYLNFAERARTELVRELGVSQQEMAKDGVGYAFAVRHAAIDFLRPARLDDLLEVRTELVRLGGASMEAVQIICRISSENDVDAEELVRVHIKVAFISLDGKPARIPKPLRGALSQLVIKGP